MSDHILIATLKYIGVEIIWDVIYFPIWWYSKGLMRVINFCINSASFHVNRRMALGIWVKSMFKPMYGDYTREGRIISIFMRVIVLIWKLVGTVLWMAVLVVVFVLWIVLPIIVIYFILYQIFDVPLFFINEK